MDFFAAASTDGAFYDNIHVTMEPEGTRGGNPAIVGTANLAAQDIATDMGNSNAITGSGKAFEHSRAMLYDNGPIVNSEGTGAGGADESILQGALGLVNYGFGAQQSAGNSIADDFDVEGTWTVDNFEFFSYQTGSSLTSPITGAFVQVWDGAPNAGGSVIWGDLTTNRMTSTSFANIYRNNNGPGGATDRPVMLVVAGTPGLSLTTGTYWVQVTLAGSASFSGPWIPPITINGQTTTGDALQYTSTGWATMVDGTFPQGMPFIVNGTSGGGGGGGTFDPGEFLGANVYRDGLLIAEMVQDTFYLDPDVEPGYYDYCVTFVYEEGAESCLGTCVLDVLVTEDCVAPLNLTAEVEGTNQVNLVWNENISQEFRYDDGIATAQLGSSTGTINTVLGSKHDVSADLTEMSWYLTGEGGPHGTVQIYVFGLTGAGLPDGSNVLYTASVSNTDNVWNTYTFPTTVVADGGFFLGVAFNGFVAIGTDDGVGAPWVFQNNTHYFVGDYTAGGWETWETYGFNFNGTIRAIGVPGAVASYAVNEGNVGVVVDHEKRFSTMVYRKLAQPVVTGEPQWSQEVRSASRSFLGYNIYRDGALLEALWPETSYTYMEGTNGTWCYTVTAEYEFCGETDPSNEACIDITVGIDDLSVDNVRIYPNPSNSIVNIELTDNISHVVIYNYIGQVVFEQNVTKAKTIQLNVSNYEAGAYLVKFVTRTGESFAKKIVVAQ
jgi:hypothetical protein